MKDFEKDPGRKSTDALPVARDSQTDRPAPAQAGGNRLAWTLRKLQQSYGNRFVQRLIGRMRGTESDQSQALGPVSRREMEAAFGEDFGDVRIHAGPQAQAETERQGARALTRGRDVYFNTGEYRPSEGEGRKLLAHELAHVAQHKAARKSKTGPAPRTSLEREAQQAENAIAAGRPFLVQNRATGAAVQHKQKEKKEEKPAILRHAKIITPLPPSGVIDAGGRFTVSYSFSTTVQAVLTLLVPGGVAVTVTPMGGAEGYTVQDSGVGSSRTVSITVSAVGGAAARLQVTFTQGGFTYIVLFQFPPVTALVEPAESEGGEAAPEGVE